MYYYLSVNTKYPNRESDKNALLDNDTRNYRNFHHNVKQYLQNLKCKLAISVQRQM